MPQLKAPYQVDEIEDDDKREKILIALSKCHRGKYIPPNIIKEYKNWGGIPPSLIKQLIFPELEFKYKNYFKMQLILLSLLTLGSIIVLYILIAGFYLNAWLATVAGVGLTTIMLVGVLSIAKQINKNL